MQLQQESGALDIGGQSVLPPMDAAMEYLRRHAWRVLPLYAVAMSLHAAAMMMVIDVVTSQQRSAMSEACLWMTAATLWRWVWQSAAQRRVQQDLIGRTPAPLRSRLGYILMLRLYAIVAMTWGGFLLIPAFYGFFLAGFAAPMALDQGGGTWASLRLTIGWITRGASRLSRVMSVLAVLCFLLLIAYFTLHGLLLQAILPSFLGLDVSDMAITLNSWPWLLCAAYVLFILFDLYWTVLSVFLFYSLQTRRVGADLRLRLNQIRGERA